MSKKDKRICQRNFSPQRKIFLWGLDNENNPCFLVLYGLHEFKTGYELKENVAYTNYVIFRGKNGHFPSFENVKIIADYNYKTRQSTKIMYYKSDINKYRYYYYYLDENNEVEGFKNLNENEAVILPYFENMTYKDYLNAVKEKNLKLDNFIFAEDLKDIFNLDDELISYYEMICHIFLNSNIYMRKKYLRKLINLNPPKKLYDFILKCGSVELISGLFLELSLKKDDILLKEAKDIVNIKIDWTSECYSKGLKRCVYLYINSLDENLKNERIKFIYEKLEDMDLKLLYIENKEIPKDKILEGKDYRKYALCNYLSSENNYYYENYGEERKEITKRYKESYYCDKFKLDINKFKNTIQEAEIYNLPDVIGKIAYYLDAPRLTYYFKGNYNYKGLQYFKRYLRRIMDFYARNDEDKFIKSMKVLFTSYTNADYLCKFKGNFQFNYFIKHYLYYDFKEKAPEEWYERDKWMRNDQLSLLEGRYEFMPEIWDRHLNDIIDIIQEASVDVILKAFYYILKDCFSSEKIESIDYNKLIKLSSCKYEPVSNMFKDILYKKLDRENNFDINIMFSFIRCGNKELYDIAMNYFYRTNGKIEANDLLELMFFDNFEEWTDLFLNNMQNMGKDKLCLFIKEIFSQRHKFINKDFSENIKNLLFETVKNMNLTENNLDLISFIISELYSQQNFTDFILEITKNIIFSIQYNKLKNILNQIEMKDIKSIKHSKIKSIICFLKSIKENCIPADSQIIEILKLGTAGEVKILIENMKENITKLYSRFSTLLIMLECDVESINEMAKYIFETMQKQEQKQLHFIIIDSPKKKAYDYGIKKLYDLYEDINEVIPAEFIIKMLEHSSVEVKSYISNKITKVINNFENGNEELFIYYAKTVLFLPNKVSKIKENIYNIIPLFVNKYKHKYNDVEKILFDIGGSNIILDSERALVALAKIKSEQ